MFKTALSLLSPSLILMGWVASPSSQASDYPPGYEIFRHCQVQGPVSVCAINREGGNFPRLEIFYAGEIRPSSVWIRLNGRDGAFGGSSFWQIGAPTGIKRCYVRDPARPAPMPGMNFCPEPASISGGSLRWTYTPPTAAESALFFYAYNANGVMNAWDLEVAFSSSLGQWDSLGGANYRFRFE